MNTYFGLDELEWNDLTETVRGGQCTPFLGAGAASNLFGSTKEIAREMSSNAPDLLKAYPDNLPKIAQQLRARLGPMSPRQRMARLLKSKAPASIKPPDTPHMALASLDLPVWITTAYDDLIERALVENSQEPQVRLCNWAPFGQYQKTIRVPIKNSSKFTTVVDPFAESQEPTTAQPLVYHLYGHVDWEESLVVSEFDYFEFLASTAQHTDRAQSDTDVRSDTDVGKLSPAVESAITRTSLLFLGYRLGDLDFRILLHSIKHRTTRNLRLNLAIQLEPEDAASEEIQRAVGEAPATRDPNSSQQQDKLRKYAELDLKQYFPNAEIKVLFADCETFATELAKSCTSPPPSPAPKDV